MKKTLAVALIAVFLGGCATTQERLVTERHYIVVVPPAELTEPPSAEREKALQKLDVEKATDVDLSLLLLDKQNYINAMEKQLAVLRKWYHDRIELLKKNRDIKPERLEIVN